MKRKLISMLLAAAMGAVLLAGCGGEEKKDTPATNEEGTTKESSEEKSEETESEEKEAPAENGDQEVLEFYHGYYHDESEWPAAKVMRDIYDEFAAQHADGPVTFKPIPVENRDDIVSTEVAGGSFPDMVDCGVAVPLAAISQNLVYDMKPFIDENGLQAAVGINYTQNDIDGKIYSVHDQLQSRGMWYNTKVLEAANVNPEDLNTWDGFAAAMESVRGIGDGTYGYAAGQGSFFMLNAYLASTEEGRALMETDLTPEGIESEAFATAFKAIAKLDQDNGSDHTVDDLGLVMDDFNKAGTMAVLPNGVWNAGGIDESLADAIEPMIFPENVSLSSAGAGLTIANNMSEAKTELALEFVRYMTSKEVAEKIFTGVQANPCNTEIDLNALAEASGDPVTMKLAKACTMVNEAGIISQSVDFTWGSDVTAAIRNALKECAVAGADIDARFEQLKQELTAIIG